MSSETKSRQTLPGLDGSPVSQRHAPDEHAVACAPDARPFNTPVRFPTLRALDQFVGLQPLGNGTFRLLSEVRRELRPDLAESPNFTETAPLPGDEIQVLVPPGGGMPHFIRVVTPVPTRCVSMLVDPDKLTMPEARAVLARIAAEGGRHEVEGDRLTVILPRDSALNVWDALEPTEALVPYQRGLDVPIIGAESSSDEVLAAFDVADRVFHREANVAIRGLAINIGTVFLHCGQALRRCRQLLLGKLAQRRAGSPASLVAGDAVTIAEAIGELRKVQGRVTSREETFAGYVVVLERMRAGTLPPDPASAGAADDEADPDVPEWSRPVQIGRCVYFPQGAHTPAGMHWPVRRPRSARLVGRVAWTWGPCNSRTDALYVSLDADRRHYLLWLEWDDPECAESMVRAYVDRKRFSEKEAVKAMLFTCYRGELQEFGAGAAPDAPWGVWQPGMLSPAELMEVARRIWPEAGERDAAPSAASTLVC